MNAIVDIVLDWAQVGFLIAVCGFIVQGIYSQGKYGAVLLYADIRCPFVYRYVHHVGYAWYRIPELRTAQALLYAILFQCAIFVLIGAFAGYPTEGEYRNLIFFVFVGKVACSLTYIAGYVRASYKCWLSVGITDYERLDYVLSTLASKSLFAKHVLAAHKDSLVHELECARHTKK